MNDPLGDTTSYLNSEGQVLYIANDNFDNGVNVLYKKNLDDFKKLVALLNTKQGQQHSNVIYYLMKGAGVSYVASDFFIIYDYWKNEEYQNPDYVPIDEKGPLIKEYAIQLFNVNRRMTPSGEDDKNGTPGGYALAAGDGKMHIHPNEGRRIMHNGQKGTYLRGEAGMESDIQRATNNPGSVYFDAVVTGDEIRVFNSGGVKVYINRNGHVIKK